MSKHWWDAHPGFLENHFGYHFDTLLEKHAADHGLSSYDIHMNDRAPFVDVKQLLSAVEGFGLRLAQVSLYPSDIERPSKMLLVSEDSFVYFGNGSDNTSIKLGSLDHEKLKKMVTSLKERLPVRKTGGDRSINYITASPGGGIGISRIGKQTQPFVRENYADSVLNDYDHVVSCLSAEYPCGRLTIFDGPPGTGKTHMLRGLVHEVPDATFVIVPVDVIGLVVAPGSVGSLVNIRSGKKGPLVFLIEDADHALAPRGADNISLLSAILNLGDGLLGELMDVRIVCTTNAGNKDMDAAIMRPGRTCRHTTVGPLGAKKADDVFRRLLGDRDAKGGIPEFTSKTTLADTYLKARGAGWSPPKNSSARLFDDDDEAGYEY